MEKKIERKKKDEGLENRKKKSRGTKSKGLFVLRNHDKKKSYHETQERWAFFEKTSTGTSKNDIVVFCNKSLANMVTIVNPNKNQLLSDTSAVLYL